MRGVAAQVCVGGDSMFSQSLYYASYSHCICRPVPNRRRSPSLYGEYVIRQRLGSFLAKLRPASVIVDRSPLHRSGYLNSTYEEIGVLDLVGLLRLSCFGVLRLMSFARQTHKHDPKMLDLPRSGSTIFTTPHRSTIRRLLPDSVSRT